MDQLEILREERARVLALQLAARNPDEAPERVVEVAEKYLAFLIK